MRASLNRNSRLSFLGLWILVGGLGDLTLGWANEKKCGSAAQELEAAILKDGKSSFDELMARPMGSLEQKESRLVQLKKDPNARPDQIDQLQREIRDQKWNASEPSGRADFQRLLTKDLTTREGRTPLPLKGDWQVKPHQEGPIIPLDEKYRVAGQSSKEFKEFLKKDLRSREGGSREIEFSNGLKFSVDSEGKFSLTDIGYTNKVEIDRAVEEFNQLGRKMGFNAHLSKEGQDLLKKITELRYPDEPFTLREREMFKALQTIDRNTTSFRKGEAQYISELEAMVARKKRLSKEDVDWVQFMNDVKKLPEKNLRIQKAAVTNELQALNGTSDLHRLSTPTTADVRKFVNLSVDEVKSMQGMVKRDISVDSLSPQEIVLMERYLKKAQQLDETGRSAPAVQFYLRRFELYRKYLEIR